MSDPLLEVKALSKSFSSGASWLRRTPDVVAVTEVSFTLARRSILGLVGESGSGKSTLARLLVRLIEADRGQVLFDGVDLRKLSPHALRRMRRRFQIVTQDPGSSFDPRVPVGSAIAQAIRLHRLRGGAGIADRVADLFDRVGLSPTLASRYPHQLSGGQLQRLAIARALSVEPELIVLDEVVSALDVLAQAQILGLIEDLRSRFGVAFVFVSHDLSAVRQIATDIGVLLSGRLIECGPAQEIVGAPRQDYTRRLLASAPTISIPPRLIESRLALLSKRMNGED